MKPILLLLLLLLTSGCAVSSAPTSEPDAHQYCNDYQTMVTIETMRCGLPAPNFEGPSCNTVTLFGAAVSQCHDVLHAMPCADLAKLDLGRAVSENEPAVCFFRSE